VPSHNALIIVLVLFLQGTTAFNLMLENAKEANKYFCSIAHSISDFKLIALEKKLTGNPVECWAAIMMGPTKIISL
jgi:hypothetical protein